MATTTFKGAVRSENGFKRISINSSGEVTEEAVYDIRPNFRQTVDNSTLNDSSGVTTTLTRAQSGTLFTIDGTGNVVVNLPALSTENVGTTYEFIVTTVVGGSTTVTFVLPGSGVSDFMGMLQLESGTAANPVGDEAGDTLTLPNSTQINARVKLTCVTDDGTNSVWKAETVSTPIATIA